MLKRTAMKPGVKIQFRNRFKLPAMGAPTGAKMGSPLCTSPYGAGNSDRQMPTKKDQPGTPVSPKFNFGDIATVTSEVRNFRNIGKQIRLEDSAGNAGWIYWAFVYLNADVI